MQPPPRPKNLHLYRLSPLIHASETSILHIVAGRHCVALATSINTLLLHRAGGDGGPPITRQVQWFAGDLKGIASMAMRDDADLLVATHDASAFVLPLRFMLAGRRCRFASQMLRRPTPRWRTTTPMRLHHRVRSSSPCMVATSTPR